MAHALPRFLETYETRRAHAAKLERVVRESGGDLRDERPSSHTAVDGLSLRGIPAIGKSVPGVIRGTSPGSTL